MRWQDELEDGPDRAGGEAQLAAMPISHVVGKRQPQPVVRTPGALTPGVEASQHILRGLRTKARAGVADRHNHLAPFPAGRQAYLTAP